ncbi:MAG: CARDB domain-containing protein, partial [Candidatus Thermoplasmatota archaeon]
MVFDPTFHIKMWQDNTPGHRIYGVAVGDIDGDSIREIVACDTEGEMYVYDTINYTLEWKMTIGGGTLFPLKIIDIDNDNIEDIIVTWRNPISEHDHVFVINRITHTIKWQLNFTDICFVKVADLENDGVNDIFVTHGKYLSVVDTITKILKGQILITDQMYALDVKDLDGDGSNEIIVGSSAGYLYIYNSDFTQRYYTDFVYLSPNVVVAGDSDSDGIKEIIIGAHDNRYMVGVGRILVLNGIDYSVEWESEPLWGIEWRPNFVVGLAIADVDQDGTYEIIASDRNYLYAFDGITKKMEWKSEQLSAYPVAEEHTIIAFDIDEDYQNEVIVGSRGYVYVFGIGVIGIDLVILDREIRFSDTAPSIGQTITISAIIHNKGRNATQNIVVRFFDNDVLINAATLPLVPGNNQETVATSWVVSGGHHVIRVVADPDNAVDEFNEGNNFASKQISINIPPVADAGPAQTVNIQTLVQFLGVGRDPDGRIVKYEWDFDGDGIFDWESVITGSTAYIYTQFGTYEAVLRVTDNDGAAGIDTCTISVVSIVGAPPVALPGLNQTVAFVDGKAVV